MSNTSSLEQLLALCSQHSLLVSNAFQHDNSVWQVNLRDSEKGYGFGHGLSFFDALRAAFDRYLEGDGEQLLIGRGAYSVEGPRKKAKAEFTGDIKDLEL